MNSQTLMHWACSTVGWAGFFYKLRDLWRAPRNPMLRAVCATLLLASSSSFCSAPATVGFINRVTGVANFAALFVYCVIVWLSASAHVLLGYWRLPPAQARRTARLWILTYAAITVCLMVLFALGDAPEERRVDFDTHYAKTPYIAEFIVLYLLALAAAMGGLIWMCARWARVAGRPWLRRGLLMIAAGGLGGLLFSSAKLTAVAARWADTDWDFLSSHLAPGVATLGLVLCTVGSALPAWENPLTRIGSLGPRHRAYRDLYPLWNALRNATPAIVPPAPVPRWDLELRLTRRLAEINDGRLALRAHTDPRTAGAALRLGREAGLTEPELTAVVEAARLKTAVAAKAAQRRFPPDPAADRERPPGGADGVDELAWLVAVSRAFNSSEVVAAVAARYAGPGGDVPGAGDSTEDSTRDPAGAARQQD